MSDDDQTMPSGAHFEFSGEQSGSDETAPVDSSSFSRSASNPGTNPSGQFFRPVKKKQQVGQSIGNYRIVRTLGEGGMGVVYLAERADGEFEQQVALKLAKTALTSPGEIDRFRRERQLLVKLNHANIARVIDGGTTEDGQPYFVMEYIEGQRIDNFCDAQRLTTQQRLELFAQVCDAVEYCHQNLIVHRDIKPGNILVTKDGEVKLLDFGIAKVLDPSLFDMVDMTEGDMRLMTLAYASPEQVSGEPITPASDIYSLGVLLYELVTGRLPYNLRDELKYKAKEVICNYAPELPSTAITKPAEVSAGDGTTSTVEPGEIAQLREAADPARLKRTLSGDVDDIVMVSLAKAPTLRYASVERLRADIGAHLDGGLVEARKTRRSVNWSIYATKRFVRRYRTPVAAGVAAVLALMIGLSIALVQWQAAVAAKEQEREAKERTRAIANGLLEEISENVMVLPGALRVREAVSNLALEHLEAMQNDPSWGESSLLLDVALGYERLGDIEAGLRNARRGNFDSAQEHFAKSRELREQAGQAGDSVILQLAESDKRQGDVRRERDDNQGSADAYEAGLARLDQLQQTESNATQTRLLRAQLQGSLANALARAGDQDNRVRTLRESALQTARELVAEDASVEHRLTLGLALHRLADMERREQNTQQAVQLSDEATTIYRDLFNADPVNAFIRRRLGSALSIYAFALRDAQAELPTVLPVVNEAIFHLRFLKEADPMDASAQRSLALVLELAAYAQLRTQPVVAHDHLGEAIDLHNQVMAITGSADYANNALLAALNQAKASYYAGNMQRCAQEMLATMEKASQMIEAGDARRNVLTSYVDAANNAFIALAQIYKDSPDNQQANQIAAEILKRIIQDEPAVQLLVGDQPSQRHTQAIESLAQSKSRFQSIFNN